MAKDDEEEHKYERTKRHTEKTQKKGKTGIKKIVEGKKMKKYC